MENTGGHDAAGIAPFKFWPKYAVIFCPPCGYCPVPQRVHAHLFSQHMELSRQQRKIIAQAVLSIPGIALKHEQVKYPAANSPPIGGIPILPAFVCKATKQTENGYIECGYICQSLNKIQEHYFEIHGWINYPIFGADAKPIEPKQFVCGKYLLARKFSVQVAGSSTF